jgi:hypothetical protein
MKRTVFLLFLCSISCGSLFLWSHSEDTEIVLNAPTVSNEYTNIVFHYEDSFSLDEKEKLEYWLKETAQAAQKTLGKYPFPLHFYLHRSDEANEPVPWAHTQRTSDQGVHFHVNSFYSLSDFMSDWTAPHEISHLAIPFVGKSNSWFSEGFATYMQNEVLLEMGECTQKDIDKKFDSKLENAKPYYQEDQPFSEVAMGLRKKYKFPEMYWGSTLYFSQLDSILQKKENTTLVEVLKRYQNCCRLEDKNLDQLLRSLDGLVNGEPAIDLMIDYTTLPAREIF